MANSDRTLRLVLAEESVNDAEHLISVLRNAGHAVRCTRVDDAEALQETLHGQRQELFLCAPRLANLPLETALRVVHQSSHDPAILILTDEEDPQLRRDVMAMGAADLVTKADTEHLRRAVEREYAAVATRRSLRRLEVALRETERRCETLLESSRDAIAYVHEGMHIYANRAYLERFGVARPEDIEGVPLLDLIASDEQSHFRDFFRQYSRGDASEAELATRIRSEAGDEQDVRLTLAVGSWDGEQATQILIRENDQAALEERLQYLSRRDMLTGLFNRNHFLDHVGRVLNANRNEADGAQHGLLYLSLDHVETIQQNLGIAALDRVIADTAELLSRHVADQAVAARYADAVFTVLLPQADVHDALGAAESIRQALETHISETGHRTITKSASIGVALIGDNVGTAEEGVNIVAAAAAQATSDGGNRVHLHAGGESEGEADAASWRTRLEDGLADGLVGCLYQPIVALKDGDTARYELTARLDDDHGQADDSTLREQAERADMATALDRYLFHQGLRALAAAAPARPVLFVSVSSASLADDAFLTYVRQQLADVGVHGSQIVPQVSEPVAVTQLNQALALVEGVRGLGGSTCLDAFGSGLDSFRLLGQLPVDYLRLAPSLIGKLGDSEDATAHIRDIVANARDGQQQVIAAGFDGASQLARLWQEDIDLVQGRFLQDPGPVMDYDFSGMVI